MAYIGKSKNVRSSTRKVNFYFKCDAELVFTPKSKNLIFTDETPRFSLKLIKLLRLCLFSKNPRAVDWGYHRFDEIGAWVINTDFNTVECDMLFDTLKNQTPFGWSSMDDYTEYAKDVFGPQHQKMWEAQYRQLKSEGKEKTNSNGTSSVPVKISHFDPRIISVQETVDFNPYFEFTDNPFSQ